MPPDIPAPIAPPKPAALPERERKMLEKDVEAKVCDYARSKGFWARKFVSPANRGAPDRIFKRLRTPTFWIEFKRPGKKRTFPSDQRERAQQREHQRIRDVGGVVFIIDSVEDGKRLFDMLDEGYVISQMASMF